MKVNKINPIWLDIYQSFLSSEMTEAELYGCFYGSYNRSQIDFANQAWKSHLYMPADNKDLVKINGFTFNSSNMKNNERGLINIGMRSERALNHNYPILDGAELIGIVDVDTPYVVYGHELTDDLVMERYFTSWRWRAELVMTNKRTFTYQIFECGRLEGFDSYINILNYHVLDMHAYASMKNDVVDFVDDINHLINKWRLEGNACVPF